MKWTLQIEESRTEAAVDGERLRQRLLQLHEQARTEPFFAMLNAPDGASLAVGLGRDLSVLSYTAPGGWPARHAQSGTAIEGFVSYKYFGHFSEMPARCAVPFAAALDAVIEFFNYQRLSAELEWVDD